MKKIVFISLAVASNLSILGCSLAPQYVRPTGAIPPAIQIGKSTTVSESLALQNLTWQTFFIEPQLREVIEIALRNNRDLRLATATANVEKARAKYRVQRADNLPSLSVSSAAVYSNNQSGAYDASNFANSNLNSNTSKVENSDSYAFSAGMSAFEIHFFGRIKNMTNSSLQLFFASEDVQATTRIAIIAETASAYLTLAADKEQLEIAKSIFQIVQETSRLTKTQFMSGMKSELEFRQSEIELEKTRSKVSVISNKLKLDRNALELLVGQSVPDHLLPNKLGASEQTLSYKLPMDLSSEVLLNRPDIRQAEHLLLAENANIGVARAALFPRISLTAAAGVASSSLL